MDFESKKFKPMEKEDYRNLVEDNEEKIFFPSLKGAMTSVTAPIYRDIARLRTRAAESFINFLCISDKPNILDDLIAEFNSFAPLSLDLKQYIREYAIQHFNSPPEGYNTADDTSRLGAALTAQAELEALSELRQTHPDFYTNLSRRLLVADLLNKYCTGSKSAPARYEEWERGSGKTDSCEGVCRDIFAMISLFIGPQKDRTAAKKFIHDAMARIERTSTDMALDGYTIILTQSPYFYNR